MTHLKTKSLIQTLPFSQMLLTPTYIISATLKQGIKHSNRATLTVQNVKAVTSLKRQ